MLIPVTQINASGSVGTPPYLGDMADAGSASVLGSTDAYVIKIWVPTAFTATSVGFRVNNSGGNMLVGLYDGSGTLLRNDGSAAVPASGARSRILGASVSLSPGTCYAVIQLDNGTAAFYLASAGIGVGYSFTNTYGSGLPAVLPALTNLATPVPLTIH